MEVSVLPYGLCSRHLLVRRHTTSILSTYDLTAGTAVVVGSMPTLKSLFIRRSDNSSAARSTTLRGTKITANSSKGPHIRLYDMQSSGIKSAVRAGYDSDEALSNGNNYTIGGITKTHQITVSTHEAGRDSSSESFK